MVTACVAVVRRSALPSLLFSLVLGALSPTPAADHSDPPSAHLAAAPATPAQDPSEHHDITPSCRAEVKQLCRGILPGGGRIKKCIEANENKLSPPCRKAVQERLEQEGAKK
jgi:hypothetical protein